MNKLHYFYEENLLNDSVDILSEVLFCDQNNAIYFVHFTFNFYSNLSEIFLEKNVNLKIKIYVQIRFSVTLVEIIKNRWSGFIRFSVFVSEVDELGINRSYSL